MSEITVDVKIRPYLKEYIVNRYGSEPVAATSANKVFPVLAEFLTKVPRDYKPFYNSLNYVRFGLPHNKIIEVRSMNYIHPLHFGKIQTYFYGLFQFDFLNFMNKFVVQEGYPIKTSIINFCELNNMSFDTANYDSLKRIYLRYRRNAENTAKKVPTF